MKLSIYALVDNTASSGFYAEHGLSYLIEYDERILLDTGQTELYISNANKLGISTDSFNTIVLSHGHYDHGNGLSYLKGKNLICHPGVFVKRYSGKQRKYVGLNQDKIELSQRYQLHTSKDPVWLSNNMVFLGEIPRKIGFENHSTSFFLEDGSPDPLHDDTAITIKMPQGLFIISGCAHSGICNIINHAIDVTGIKKVFGVIGGFHLKQNNKQTQQTIDFFSQLNIPIVMPSHCTDLPALSEIYRIFKGEQVKAGTLYTFEDSEV